MANRGPDRIKNWRAHRFGDRDMSSLGDATGITERPERTCASEKAPVPKATHVGQRSLPDRVTVIEHVGRRRPTGSSRPRHRLGRGLQVQVLRLPGPRERLTEELEHVGLLCARRLVRVHRDARISGAPARGPLVFAGAPATDAAVFLCCFLFCLLVLPVLVRQRSPSLQVHHDPLELQLAAALIDSDSEGRVRLVR